jgi:hypothetical protein
MGKMRQQTYFVPANEKPPSLWDYLTKCLQVKLLSYRKFTSEFSSDLQVHLSVLISILFV